MPKRTKTVRMRSRPKPETWFRRFWLACLGLTFLLMLKTLAVAEANSPSIFLVFRAYESNKTVWEVSFESDSNTPCRLRGRGVDDERLKQLAQQHCSDLANLGQQVKEELRSSGTKKGFRLKPKKVSGLGFEVRGYGAVVPLEKGASQTAASQFLSMLQAL